MRSISVLGAILTISIAVFAAEISTAEDLAVEIIRNLAPANNELAFTLHRRLVNGSSQNVFFSPLGISTAFGLLLYRTRDTAEKLENAFCHKKAKSLNDDVNDTVHHYISDLLKTMNSSDGYVLNSANTVRPDENVEMFEAYKRNVEELYSSVINRLNFPTEGSIIVSVIDLWVKEKIIGKTGTLRGVMGSDSRQRVMNVLDLKGTWKTQFDPRRTSKGVFYNNGLESEAMNVSMMLVESTFNVVFSEEFKALELPYKDSKVSMLILLPRNRDGLQALEKSLTPEKLANIQKKMRPLRISFSLPKFSLEYWKDFTGYLQALGASERADFSRISMARNATTYGIRYMANIRVNEEGSVPASVINVSKEKRGLVPFVVNHPFLFAIMEKGSKSNMILYLGRVNNLLNHAQK